MELALLGLYALTMAVSARGAGRGTDAAFFVNNRASGPWGVAFSILVSCVGASATLGMIGMAFAVGTPAFWWLGAGSGGLSLLALLLARAVRRSGAYTMPHLVARFLGQPARPLIALVIVVAWSAILAAQFTAVVRVLEPLTGLGSTVCLGLGFVLIAGHTLGGQAAVMRADRVQALILGLSLLVLLIWLSARNPQWPSLTALEAVNARFPADKLIYFLVVVGANYLVCPMLFGRLLAARDERSARLGGGIAAVGLLACSGLIVAVGLACVGLIPADTPQDAVLTTVLARVLPPWMQLVVSFALLSAVVSSADSCLVTASTVLSFDLLGLRSAKAGRICVILLGLAGAGLSLWGKGILGFLLMAYDVYACGVVAPVFVGLLLRKFRRIDSCWACAAVASGGLLGAAAAVSGQAAWTYAGLGVSGLLALAGALVSRGGPEADLAGGVESP